MDNEKIKAMIKAASSEGRIQCAAAFKVAEEAEAPLGLVGRLINDLGIKIAGCQLGCF